MDKHYHTEYERIAALEMQAVAVNDKLEDIEDSLNAVGQSVNRIEKHIIAQKASLLTREKIKQESFRGWRRLGILIGILAGSVGLITATLHIFL